MKIVNYEHEHVIELLPDPFDMDDVNVYLKKLGPAMDWFYENMKGKKAVISRAPTDDFGEVIVAISFENIEDAAAFKLIWADNTSL